MVDRAGVLKNAPLVFVVCGVRFRARESVPTWIGSIQERVYDRFPLMSKVQLKAGAEGIEIAIDPADFDESQSSASFVFMSEDRSRAFQLWKGGLALQAKEYRHFDDFCADFQCALDALLGLAQHLDLEAAGIRYVDHIRPARAEEKLSQYVNASLLPFQPAWNGFEGVLTGGSSNHLYALGDATLRVKLTTGASSYVIADDLLSAYIATVKPSPGTEAPVPCLNDNEGSLDIDAFRSKIGLKVSNSAEVTGYIRRMHEICNDYFRNICTDKAFEFWKEERK